MLDLGTGCGGPTGEHPHHLLTPLHRKKTSACCTPLVIGGGWDASGRGGGATWRGGGDGDGGGGGGGRRAAGCFSLCLLAGRSIPRQAPRLAACALSSPLISLSK